MTDNQALEILRAQGHAVSGPDGNGWVRIWLHSKDDPIDVKSGRELHELAHGSIGIDELSERRENESLIEAD